MTSPRSSFMLLAALLTGASALGGCQRNPEATESHAPAASTEQAGSDTAKEPAAGASTQAGPAHDSQARPPADDTPPAR